MRDRYRKLMLTSFKDSMEIVEEYNEWCEEVYGAGSVPPQAVPQIALTLYQSRIMGSLSESTGFDVPEFDDKMYE